MFLLGIEFKISSCFLSVLLRCYPIVLILFLVFYSFESNVPFLLNLASFDFLFIFDFQQFDYGVLRSVCVCVCAHPCVFILFLNF